MEALISFECHDLNATYKELKQKGVILKNHLPKNFTGRKHYLQIIPATVFTRREKMI
jgi:hypothetical protein